jgi:3-oxoadipate enol-lactonase
MKYSLANGYLDYEIKGNGIPLLFIHGFPLSRKIWIPQTEDLCDIATVISIDLRGHGKSFPFEGPYRMDLLANDCKRLLDNLLISSPILVCGLSMGGYVTMALLRNYPHLFRGMILTSTRSGPDTPQGKTNRDKAIENACQHGVAFIVQEMLVKMVSAKTQSLKPELMKSIHEIMLETSLQGVIGALQGMRDRPDSTLLLSQIQFPVLIIHGEDDQLIPLQEPGLMNKQIPNSRLVVIPEAGHLLNLEQPEKFNRAVREFISTLA